VTTVYPPEAERMKSRIDGTNVYGLSVRELATRRMAAALAWARANVRPDPNAAERIARVERRRETGEWIRTHAAWTHFYTLTFAAGVSEDEAVQLHWAWLKVLARRRDLVRDHIRVAYAVERGAGRSGRVHLHGLLAVPAPRLLRVEDARLAWHQLHRFIGFDRFVRYTDGRGGPWYIVKTDEWDIGTACPRRFARCGERCAEDPTPR
jgi:hypothetical protein